MSSISSKPNSSLKPDEAVLKEPREGIILTEDPLLQEMAEQLIIFSLGTLPFMTEEYLLGMQLFYVQEIINIPSIMRVPNSPFFVWGLTTWRGKFIPVVDLGIRLGLAATVLQERSRLIVVQTRPTAHTPAHLVGLLAHHIVRITPLTGEMNPRPHPEIRDLQTDLLRVTLLFEDKPLFIPNLSVALDPHEAER